MCYSACSSRYEPRGGSRSSWYFSPIANSCHAVPLIGLALAAGVPPDYATEAKAVARRPRNHVLAMLILICLAVMVLQPQLALWLVVLFGLDAAGFVVSILTVAALALPLAMTDSATPIRELPESRY